MVLLERMEYNQGEWEQVIRPDYNKESQGNKSNYTALLYIGTKKKKNNHATAFMFGNFPPNTTKEEEWKSWKASNFADT